VPRRRCVGCGRIAPKSELVRLAVSRVGEARGALVVRDRAGTMPGRGAYLCRDSGSTLPLRACTARAIRRGGIARALRASVTLDPEIIELVS
jgi:predicted RNA-binding protein YlxR (DUF448 family)